MLDGVVVINELVDLAKCRKDSCVMLKVDFERPSNLRDGSCWIACSRYWVSVRK